MDAPVKVFVSYSHKDSAFLEALNVHCSSLRRSQQIALWTDNQIAVGSLWDDSIKENLRAADLILLLISADFAASDFIWEVELAEAMARHKAKTAVVVPIFLRSFDSDGQPYMFLQGLPGGPNKPIERPGNDEAWTIVAKGIRGVVATIQNGKAAAAPSPVLPNLTTIQPGSKSKLPAQPDLSAISYDHCLRPELTRSLVQTLFVRRESVNLVVSFGQGGERIPTDVAACRIPQTLVVDVLMKNYVRSWSGFMADIAGQTGMAQRGERLLIFLRGFEFLLNESNLDGGYDDFFYGELNALRNRPDIRLAVKTPKPHNTFQFRGQSSWLTMNVVSIAALSLRDLQSEVARRPNLAAHADWLIGQLEFEAAPYLFLEKMDNALVQESALDQKEMGKMLRAWREEGRR